MGAAMGTGSLLPFSYGYDPYAAMGALYGCDYSGLSYNPCAPPPPPFRRRGFESSATNAALRLNRRRRSELPRCAAAASL